MKFSFLLLSVLIITTTTTTTFSQEIFELTTGLDDPRLRFFFHGFRDFVFNTIGKTSYKTKGVFLQEKFSKNAKFPCDVELGKSREPPKSVHKLRPGGKLLKFCESSMMWSLELCHTVLIVKCHANVEVL